MIIYHGCPIQWLESYKIRLLYILCTLSHYDMTNVAITRFICFIALFVRSDFSTFDILFILKASPSFIYHNPMAFSFSMKAEIF